MASECLCLVLLASSGAGLGQIATDSVISMQLPLGELKEPNGYMILL
jgi:hypothetical protein